MKLSERVRNYEFDIPDAYGANRPYVTVDTDKIADKIESLERQNAMLLEALKKIAALNTPIDIVDVMDETARKAVDIANAAIKSVEGDK